MASKQVTPGRTDPRCPCSAFSHMFLQLQGMSASTLILTSARGHVNGTVVTYSIQSLYQFMLRLKTSEDMMFDHAACYQHSRATHKTYRSECKHAYSHGQKPDTDSNIEECEQKQSYGAIE